jgi:hypothetical protein
MFEFANFPYFSDHFFILYRNLKLPRLSSASPLSETLVLGEIDIVLRPSLGSNVLRGWTFWFARAAEAGWSKVFCAT